MVIADGFCDDEAFLSESLLRESNIETKLCALENSTVISSNGVECKAFPLFSEQRLEEYSALIICGGLKCVKRYKENWGFVESLITKPEALYLCAISSVPAVLLAPLGLLEGKEATCLPLVSSLGMGYQFSDKNVCISKDIITGKDKECIPQFIKAVVDAIS